MHYLADVLEAHLAPRTRPGIVISDERGVLLETGGGVMKAWPQLSAGPFLIHNSDSVWIEGSSDSSRQSAPNLDRLCEGFDASRMDSLMLLAPAANSLGYDGDGDFDMDGEGRLIRRGDKRNVPYVFAGVSIAHPRLFDGASPGRFSLNRVWDRAIARGRLYGLVLDGIWMHVGTPEAVIDAERLMTREEAR